MNKRPSKPIFWQEHIEKCNASGLSQKEYCNNNDLNLAQMGYWRRRLRSLKQNATLPTSSGFVAVPITSTADHHLTVTLPSGISVSGFRSVDDAAKLVKALL